MKLILTIYLVLTLVTFGAAIFYMFKFIKGVNKIKGLDTSMWGFVALIILMSPLILILSMLPILSQVQLYRESQMLDTTCQTVAETIK